MNEWIHPHLPISHLLSPQYPTFKSPRTTHINFFLKTLHSFFSNFSEMVPQSPQFLGEECLVSCFLAFICFPLCAITTPSSLFTCITSLFRLYYLLQRQLIADFTLVFLSLSFLNSILPNRAKLILSSVLRLFSLSCLHPQKI